jgi:hypothetical protein
MRRASQRDHRSVGSFDLRDDDRAIDTRCAPTHFNAALHASRRVFDAPQRRRAAAHRSIPLAIRGTLSHNRDEFKNSKQRQRAGDAQALSNSKAGGGNDAAMMATSQTPSRQLARFEARFFRTARSTHFRTRWSARIA